MNDDIEIDSYSFSYFSADGMEVTVAFELPDDTTLMEVAEKFARFLTGVFGYAITCTSKNE